jgi:hypothetical protein
MIEPRERRAAGGTSGVTFVRHAVAPGEAPGGNP